MAGHTNKGRRNHRWGFLDDNDECACRKCGLIERTAFYSAEDGRVFSVIAWRTPDDRVLAIRPCRVYDPPVSAPPMAAAFPGVPVSGLPECPGDPASWSERA